MNLRERAARDMQNILNDKSGAGTEFFLKPDDEAEFPITGNYGDIGYLLNTDTGEAVEGRTIEAAFSLLSLAKKTDKEPKRGWGFRCKDLSGKDFSLFVVKYEPDYTVGIGRIKLAVKHE